MVGGMVAEKLRARGLKNVLTPQRDELELMDPGSVDAYFESEKPEIVFMIAAKVGGIGANVADPTGFLVDNSKMQINLFEACHKFGTKKNLFLGSSCIYPRECPQPMKEEYLLTGPVEPTNEGYALAKIMGLKLAEYYYRQHGMVTVCPMPCNIYGTNDHYDLERSHVLSALVMRFVEAVERGAETVTLWGTGGARREFIHVDDAADAILFLIENRDEPGIINVGTGVDVSIKELAEKIAALVGFGGVIEWDAEKPDGMPRKCLDVTRLNKAGFSARISLEEGLERTVAEYRELREKRKTK